MITSAFRREATPPWARNFASLTRRESGEVPAKPPRCCSGRDLPRLPLQGSARCSPAFRSRSRSSRSSSGVGIELGRIGQLVETAEAEEAFEQLGRLEQGGAELRASRLLDQAALGQRLHGRLRGDAADARDLGPGDRLQVGDDRQRLRLRLGQRRRARLGQQAARRVLARRVAGEREAAGDLAQDDAAPALGEVLAQQLDRLGDLALGRLGRLDQVGGKATGWGERKSSASIVRLRSLMPSCPPGGGSRSGRAVRSASRSPRPCGRARAGRTG